MIPNINITYFSNRLKSFKKTAFKDFQMDEVICLQCGVLETDCRQFHCDLVTPSYGDLVTPSYAMLNTPDYATMNAQSLATASTSSYAPSANGLLFLDFDLDENNSNEERKRQRAGDEEKDEEPETKKCDRNVSEEDEW